MASFHETEEHLRDLGLLLFENYSITPEEVAQTKAEVRAIYDTTEHLSIRYAAAQFLGEGKDWGRMGEMFERAKLKLCSTDTEEATEAAEDLGKYRVMLINTTNSENMWTGNVRTLAEVNDALYIAYERLPDRAVRDEIGRQLGFSYAQMFLNEHPNAWKVAAAVGAGAAGCALAYAIYNLVS